MQLAIDTLKTMRSLEGAGFDSRQAESVASVIAEALQVSREDLVTKDFLKAELAALRGDLKADIATSKNDMVRWLIGSQVALVMILVALSNFTRAFG